MKDRGKMGCCPAWPFICKGGGDYRGIFSTPIREHRRENAPPVFKNSRCSAPRPHARIPRSEHRRRGLCATGCDLELFSGLCSWRI